jgi:hypothetical protein
MISIEFVKEKFIKKQGKTKHGRSQSNNIYQMFLRGSSILNTQWLQSLYQPGYTHFTLELYCSGICSQPGGSSVERTVPG